MNDIEYNYIEYKTTEKIEQTIIARSDWVPEYNALVGAQICRLFTQKKLNWP